jgi:hypothetical protein
MPTLPPDEQAAQPRTNAAAIEIRSMRRNVMQLRKSGQTNSGIANESAEIARILFPNGGHAGRGLGDWRRGCPHSDSAPITSAS